MATKKMAFGGMGAKINSAVKAAASKAAPKPSYAKPSASDQQAAMSKVQATKAAAEINKAKAAPPVSSAPPKSMGSISRAIASAKNSPDGARMVGKPMGGMGMKKGGKARKK